MSASYPLAGLVTIEFEREWQQRLQQMTSRLLQTVTRTTINGDRKRMQQLGALNMRQITGRALATVPDDSTIYNRWLYANEFELVTWIDEWDKEAMAGISDPVGPHMVAHLAAYERQVDATIRDGVQGTSYTGTDGTTGTTVPSSQRIDEDYGTANSGLTFAKVAQAKYILDNNEVPLENRWFICGAQEMQDLITNTQELTNLFYSNVQPINKGGISNGTEWMGFKWVTNYQRLTNTLESGTQYIRQCLAYQADYVKFGDGERRASVDLLPAFSHATQIRTRCRMGATRTQEEAVVIVEAAHGTP